MFCYSKQINALTKKTRDRSHRGAAAGKGYVCTLQCNVQTIRDRQMSETEVTHRQQVSQEGGLSLVFFIHSTKPVKTLGVDADTGPFFFTFRRS